MNNRQQLQKFVEELGYDDGMGQILVKGVRVMPESDISETLGKFISYQESMPAILDEVAAFIAHAESESRRSTQLGVARKTNKIPPLPTKSKASNSKPAPDKRVELPLTRSTEIDSYQTPIYLTEFLDLTITWTTVMLTMTKSYLSFFQNYLPSDSLNKTTGKSKQRNRLEEAMNSMLTSSASAFDQMTQIANQISEIAEANLRLSERSLPKKANEALEKGRISRRK